MCIKTRKMLKYKKVSYVNLCVKSSLIRPEWKELKGNARFVNFSAAIEQILSVLDKNPAREKYLARYSNISSPQQFSNEETTLGD